MKHIGIIGGGPAGLMAAEAISGSGCAVTVFEAMPTVGRKLLMAGKSGLNLTHAEPHDSFLTRFDGASSRLKPMLDAFTAADARVWATGLGQETFVGSSGRVFPTIMKASPLLRAWMARLETNGVTVLTRHRWIGFADGQSEFAGRAKSGLVFETPSGIRDFHFDAVILALGGASWPRLGADAAWVPLLGEKGVAVNAFRPANCGFDVDWSAVFSERFAGQPVKSVAASSDLGTTSGEFVITRSGIEGSLVYMHSAALRDALEHNQKAALVLDMMPGRDEARIVRDLEKVGSKASFANRLRKIGLDPVKTALVREFSSEDERADAHALARCIKALPLTVRRPRPIAEAISSAGGVDWGGIDASLMLKSVPGVFVAGEMLDWEAPTGGYLLTACLATGRWAGMRAMDWVDSTPVASVRN